MVNEDERQERRTGLMIAVDRIIRDYGNEYRARMHADKYGEVIKMIQKQRGINYWMSRNRSVWAWMEPENSPESGHPLQSRSDHSGRRGGHHNVPHHYQNHDPSAVDESDLDDEDDDDDSRSDDDGNYREMIVEGCGLEAINGIYKQRGSFDGVPKYTHVGHYNGREEEFSLFRCKLTDNTR